MTLLLLKLVACSGTDGAESPDGGSGGNADFGPIGTTDSGVARNDMMTFFVTSRGNKGGNFGGLAGGDAFCQALAAAAGAGHRSWRAYLSDNGTNAKDRIGAGPWSNVRGEMVAASVTALHANGLPSDKALTEKGENVPENEHDILTGTMQDGTRWTSFPGNPSAPPPNCRNWTSSSANDSVYVGHADWSLPTTHGNMVWNASHDTTCDEAGLRATAGTGRLYCFAAQ